MKTFVVKVNHPETDGLFVKQIWYSSRLRRSLNSSNFITPKEQMRKSFAGRLLFTWSFSIDLNEKSILGKNNEKKKTKPSRRVDKYQ